MRIIKNIIFLLLVGLIFPVAAIAIPTVTVNTTVCTIELNDSYSPCVPPTDPDSPGLVYNFGPAPPPQTFTINDDYPEQYQNNDCEEINQTFKIVVNSDSDQSESVNFSTSSDTSEFITFTWNKSSTTLPIPDPKGGWILSSGNTYYLDTYVSRGCRGIGYLYLKAVDNTDGKSGS